MEKENSSKEKDLQLLKDTLFTFKHKWLFDDTRQEVIDAVNRVSDEDLLSLCTPENYIYMAQNDLRLMGVAETIRLEKLRKEYERSYVTCFVESYRNGTADEFIADLSNYTLMTLGETLHTWNYFNKGVYTDEEGAEYRTYLEKELDYRASDHMHIDREMEDYLADVDGVRTKFNDALALGSEYVEKLAEDKSISLETRGIMLLDYCANHDSSDLEDEDMIRTLSESIFDKKSFYYRVGDRHKDVYMLGLIKQSCPSLYSNIVKTHNLELSDKSIDNELNSMLGEGIEDLYLSRFKHDSNSDVKGGSTK